MSEGCGRGAEDCCYSRFQWAGGTFGPLPPPPPDPLHPTPTPVSSSGELFRGAKGTSQGKREGEELQGHRKTPLMQTYAWSSSTAGKSLDIQRTTDV